ncbi:YtzH-like family protein [Fredinandcohnia quinoae]|uniref:YtzH-like family protein n=1 Tax=Fredinandcohnia quinoae TaxID=2918902 RepID=A0AAW5E646_9BACI|nr:YtzH-like family protein [Fredinandcohnia sp. SECRCQ15]MCH1625357.1 YtzH-like family protein [Fredinandcohnia sp. SECRCQ15]
MPINHTHQIDILKDILSNHQLDCCGTVAECEQLERLIQSLLVNPNIEQSVKDVLTDVYTYSQTGKYTQQLENHITSHQNQLSNWISDIDQLS